MLLLALAFCCSCSVRCCYCGFSWLCPSLSKALAVEGDPFAREFAPYIQQQRQKPLVRLNAQQLLSVLKWIAPTHAAARQQQQQPPERKTPVNAYASEELSAAQCANCAANGGSEDIQPLVWLSAWRQLLVGLMQFLPLLQIQQRLALLQTAAAADDDAAWRLSLVYVSAPIYSPMQTAQHILGGSASAG